MTSHQLARELLRAPDLTVTASIDISTCDKDYDRRIFTFDCRGVNDHICPNNEVIICFDAEPEDNKGAKI